MQLNKITNILQHNNLDRMHKKSELKQLTDKIVPGKNVQIQANMAYDIFVN